MQNRVLVMLALATATSFTSCASSDSSGVCHGDRCRPPDMTALEVDMATEQPDMAHTRGGFGEACTKQDDCQTRICVLAGTSGICSRLCLDDCPAGFGCYTVPDIIEIGHASNVCVPITTQLCTPCVRDAECSAGGHDLCLTQPSGGSFCGRDCSRIGCPHGFDCKGFLIGSAVYQQCVPHNQSCDCDDSKKGMTQPCTITTPFGTTCGGTRACLGTDQGWDTACTPGSTTDVPDDDFIDANCDGIDGDVNGGIFVSGSGVDVPSCGRGPKTPCRTITNGIAVAARLGLAYVYVQAGTYNEIVSVVDGVSVYGGYDANWQRGLHTVPGHEVRIVGAYDTGEGQFMAVKAHPTAATAGITFADLVIAGPNATQAGRSSYAVHAVNAKLTLRRVSVIAGNGAAGSSGQDGVNASTLVATDGMNAVATPSPPGPGDAHQEAFLCNNTGHGRGGDPGNNNCNFGVINPLGGAGGDGGHMDTSCGTNFNATAGLNGSDAAFTGANGEGSGGPGGAGGDGNSQAGSPGRNGRVFNGAAGLGNGNPRGVLAGLYWSALAGNPGLLGFNGSGGGGAGGSGGDDSGTDSWGAGGGGGGAGGCAALAGGGGGGPGGGSFGVFAVTSQVTLIGSDVALGVGGIGGAGGRGGTGQNGGTGARGGLPAGSSKNGGHGGDGAHGGHSGGGAGGNGGAAFGLFTSGSTVDMQTTSFSGGAPGAGGAGGPAALPAPAGGANDGNAGNAGSAGAMDNVGVCADAGGC